LQSGAKIAVNAGAQSMNISYTGSERVNGLNFSLAQLPDELWSS